MLQLWLDSKQGDQNGRIFAQWVIVYSSFFKKLTKVAHIFGLLFPQLIIIM
jgi:hypothetical protein